MFNAKGGKRNLPQDARGRGDGEKRGQRKTLRSQEFLPPCASCVPDIALCAGWEREDRKKNGGKGLFCINITRCYPSCCPVKSFLPLSQVRQTTSSIKHIRCHSYQLVRAVEESMFLKCACNQLFVVEKLYQQQWHKIEKWSGDERLSMLG